MPWSSGPRPTLSPLPRHLGSIDRVFDAHEAAASANTTTTPTTWGERLASELPARPDATLVCASGISPSGPIHMGNLREVFTTHVVVEALRARGSRASHLHSWDDYDRLRKVPAGVSDAFSTHVGKPLARVPDPHGTLPSYADRYIADFNASLERLGIRFEPRRQSDLYQRGTYNEAIRRAMDRRERIFDVLAAQQTAGRQAEPVEARRRRYYPFVVYCLVCDRDTTEITAWDGRRARWSCRCGASGSMDLADGLPVSGKLVWKVDWPMRWHHEDVAFEPAGEDHHAPTGSYTVGKELVREVFGGTAPNSTVYSFVKLAGQGGKMSGSRGETAVPADALALIEPSIVRWLYLRKLPAQSFAIDLSPKAVEKLYDEWDRFVDQATDSSGAEARILHASLSSTSGAVQFTSRRVSFRLLEAVADITQGNREQLGRIVAEHAHYTGPSEALLAKLEPRLSCAVFLAREVVPEDERTVVLDSFARGTWEGLNPATQEAVALLVADLSSHWNIDELTNLVYGVPKRMLGLPPDQRAPTPEVKQAQRAFFRALYQLLAGRDTGPRLPTFLLSIGQERARSLLDSSRVAPPV